LGGCGTWARGAGLRQAHALAADGSEASNGQGGSRRLQRHEGNMEGMTHAGVLSSHACPERRVGEALQRRPRLTGVRQASGDQGTVDRANQVGRGWTGMVVGTRLSRGSSSARYSARAPRRSSQQVAAAGQRRSEVRVPSNGGPGSGEGWGGPRRHDRRSLALRGLESAPVAGTGRKHGGLGNFFP
jgi:hypothetical protein